MTRSMLFVGLVVLCMVGCSSDPEKTSLFDHDHQTPGHWPASLADAAAKMRQRLNTLDTDQASAGGELVDLVSWTPEVAADTSISEQDWNPIYQISETVRLRLAGNDDQWDDESVDQVEQLCSLLDAAWSRLPDREKQPRRDAHTHSHDHGDHSHDHDDHSHDHGDHSHDHGDHSHDHGDHSHDHGDHSHDHDDHGDRSHDEDHSHDHGDHSHDHDDHSHDHGNHSQAEQGHADGEAGDGESDQAHDNEDGGS